MAFVALTAFLDACKQPPDGLLLTAVLPGGCQLTCPFCIVRARSEGAAEPKLAIDDIPHLIRQLKATGRLGAIAITGDEPLQSGVAWSYAQAVLNAGKEFRLPLALVTNGLELANFARDLATYDIRVIVSIDGVGSVHDAIRRKVGAFEKTSAGIREAMRFPELRERVYIGSILMPGNAESLKDVIKFAGEEGVRTVIISPLLNPSPRKPLKISEKIMSLAERELPGLVSVAKAAGVNLHCSDEFDLLGKDGEKLERLGAQVMTPRTNNGLVRVDSHGRIETNLSIAGGFSTGLQLNRCETNMSVIADDVINCFTKDEKKAA